MLDANILACKERLDLLRQLKESGAYIDFVQGVDARFITEDIAKILSTIKTKTMHFAFDLMKNEKAIIKGLGNFAKYNNVVGCSYAKYVVYILVNYDTTFEEDLYRVRKVMELGYAPDVRIYQMENAPQFCKDLARWANNRFLFNAVSLEEYEPRKGQKFKDLYKGVI